MIRQFKKLRLYYDTLKYLKPKQIYYQIAYRCKRIFGNSQLKLAESREVQLPYLIPSIPSENSYKEFLTFTFLNKASTFNKSIDWNFQDNGKLWAYNLNYFDFLNQRDVDVIEGTKLVELFCKDFKNIKEGIEPYPISLRGINWIKFFSDQKLNDPTFNSVLLCHYRHLASNIEYHLLGNHLLENGFSLLYAAYYFRDDLFYRKAISILENELKEQILKDGAHFELSPMYHQILLFRLLDCINLIKNNPWREKQLLAFLESKAILMLGWLRAVTFNNGDVPHVNDSAVSIAPTSESIFDYARRLGISFEMSALSDSGYRMIRTKRYELFVDVGNIGPDYIPGHAHSDTFNFLLSIDGFPVIVDTGTSTYEKNETRIAERSTRAHNTVELNNIDQTEVWSGFRVGRRANVISLSENGDRINSSHNGYNILAALHTREWFWTDSKIEVCDWIECKQHLKSKAYIHLDPKVQILSYQRNKVNTEKLTIEFENAIEIEIIDYTVANGFNKVINSKCIEITFSETLKTTLTIA